MSTIRVLTRVTIIVLIALIVRASDVGVKGAQSARLIIPRLHQLLSGEFPPNQPGGVVLIAQRDKVLFHRAYGLADVELNVPMQTSSVLRIGSITKQFTAVAVLKLVQEGKLSLAEQVRTYVPDLVSEDSRITIEQVLTHTSGLPNLVDLDDFDELARKDYKTEELLALTKDQKNLFAPGTDFAYSDTGYILLGAVIERVSGLSYADYLETHIFRPIEINAIYYGDDRRVIKRRAQGYSFQSGSLVNASYISMTVPHAAGGLVSTADDLLRWDIALRKGAVVRQSLLAQAWNSRTLPEGTTSGYGFGWKTCTFEGRRTIEHGGWINGFGSRAIRFPDDELNVIVLVNNDADRPDAGLLARRLARLVLMGSDKMSEHYLTSSKKEAFVGRYRLSRGGLLTISDRDGDLYYQRDTGRAARLIALSPRTLSFAEGDRTFVLNFDIGPDGRARSVQAKLTCEPVFKGERL